MPRNDNPYVPLRDIPPSMFFTFKDDLHRTVFQRLGATGPTNLTQPLYGVTYQPEDDANSCWVSDPGRGVVFRALARYLVRIEPYVQLWERIDTNDRSQG